MAEEFKVKTEHFEGPLELLLHLIEKRKLHISDVSLATVTEDFLAFLEQGGGSSISQSANFVWVASTLLLIKSKSLLPQLSLTEEEEGDIESLEHRLKLYKVFTLVSPHILHSFGEQILFSRTTLPKREPIFMPDGNCTAPGLYAHAAAIVQNLPRKEEAPEVLVQKIISLEEVVEKLSERITNNLSLSFREFSNTPTAQTKEQRVTLIVSFLAMLELVKRGVLDVKQEKHFEDITMQSEHIGIPRYN